MVHLGGSAMDWSFDFYTGRRKDDRKSLTTSEVDRLGIRGRRLLGSLILLIFNIIVGSIFGLIFAAIEAPPELAERESIARLCARLNSTMPAADWTALLAAFGVSSDDIARDIAAVESGTLHTLDRNWDNTGGMFFAFTVATTIGYGSFSPVTQEGRALTMIYSIIAIPLMLAAFTSLCSVLLRLLADKLAGRKRNLPAKTFRILDRDRSGYLDKLEVVKALRLLGLGHYSGRRATHGKKRKLREAWAKVKPNDDNQKLDVQEFMKLLKVLVPDEDHLELLVGVATRGYIAITSLITFIIFCLASTGIFIYLKREDSWTFIDSLYFTMMTFLTVGLGDLAPKPHPPSYMVLWCFLTFLGLGFTTSMVTAMTDEQLNLWSSIRGALPICCPSKKEEDDASFSEHSTSKSVKRPPNATIPASKPSVLGDSPSQKCPAKLFDVSASPSVAPDEEQGGSVLPGVEVAPPQAARLGGKKTATFEA